MNDRVCTSRDLAVNAGAQRLLMEAGYEPKGDWVFIDDLVQQFREQHTKREDLLGDLDTFLATAPSALTRAVFANFCAVVRQRERSREKARRQLDRLAGIYAKAGICIAGAEHEALALRIIELEQAVQSYAERLRTAEAASKRHESGSPFPFLVGVAIGGLMF